MADRRLGALGLALCVVCVLGACGDDDDGTAGGDGGLSGRGGSSSGRGGGSSAGRGGSSGGGAPGLSCEDFSACGGDVVGSWELTDVCFDGLEGAFAEIADAPGCEDFFQLGTITPAGEYTFDEDGTLTVAGASFAFAVELTLSPECVQGIGGAKEPVKLSAAICNSFADSLGMGDSIDEASCQFSGGDCKCSAMSGAMPIGGGGAYDVDGEELVQDGDRNGFCVEGDELRIHTSSSASQTGILTFERK